MITKAEILKTINDLPTDKFESVDDVIEELLFIEKVDEGLKAMKEGKVISEEEANRIMDSW